MSGSTAAIAGRASCNPPSTSTTLGLSGHGWNASSFAREPSTPLTSPRATTRLWTLNAAEQCAADTFDLDTISGGTLSLTETHKNRTPTSEVKPTTTLTWRIKWRLLANWESVDYPNDSYPSVYSCTSNLSSYPTNYTIRVNVPNVFNIYTLLIPQMNRVRTIPSLIAVSQFRALCSSFLHGVARTYDLGIACLSDLMFELVVNTHVDVVMPFGTLLMSAVCLFLTNKAQERRDNRGKLRSFDVFLMIAADLAMDSINWLSLPVLFVVQPLIFIWRLLRFIDRLCFACGMLLSGFMLVCVGTCGRVVIRALDILLESLCKIYGVPYHGSIVIDDAFMMTSTDNDWDARKYPKCKPYFGKRGVEFENFVRDFGAALAGDGDDDASLEQTMLGTDPGGNAAGAPPALAGAAAGRRRDRRLRELYALIYRHVPDARLREMMHASANNDGRAAFELLEANCRQQIDDLELLQMDADWNGATILNAVGYSIDSITLFSRQLNGLNALRPAGQRKTEDEVTTKFLASIDTNIEPTLGHEAKKELRAQGAGRQFVNAVTGGRDYQGCVTFFDDLWRSHFHSGDIRPRPRQQGQTDRTARADANVIDETEEALIASGNRRPAIDRQKMASEPSCWNCRGFGHMSEDCPSAKGFRAISDAIYLLTNLLPRGKGGRSNGRGVAGRGGAGRGSWRRSTRRFGNARVVLDHGFEFDQEGNIFDGDGAYVGTVDSQADSDGNNNGGDSSTPTTAEADNGDTNPPPTNMDAANVLDDDDSDGWIGDMYVVTADTDDDSDNSSTDTARPLAAEIECIAAGVSETEIRAQRSLIANYAAPPSYWNDALATARNPPRQACNCTCHHFPGGTSCIGCSLCDPQLWGSASIWDPDEARMVNRYNDSDSPSPPSTPRGDTCAACGDDDAWELIDCPCCKQHLS